MINRLKQVLNFQNEFIFLNANLKEIKKELLENRLAIGRILQNQNAGKSDSILKNIQNAEFKIFSQWGDDGIINFLVHYLDIENKKFVEFGVENYTECNTRFLLVNDNWEGLIMDGSKQHMDSVRDSDIYWRYNLKAVDTFVTAENINDLLLTNGFGEEIGLLHVDIDGNDYWIWKKISVCNPVIVIMEYNSVFGIEHPWTIPYDPTFVRSKAHYSNLYYGASLLSLCQLAEEKGYYFIGCNSNGNNAYFIRKDKIKGIEKKTPLQGFVSSKFSESRNEYGALTYSRNEQRLEIIKGLPVVNTETNLIEKIA